MKDVTNDTKELRLDPSKSTFYGFDYNVSMGLIGEGWFRVILQFCIGILKGISFLGVSISSILLPLLKGDGSIVVGSLIRLYFTTSTRQAKMAFPGLGSPITRVDVTYDGKWILGTTDTYLILIRSTLFTDEDRKMKLVFSVQIGIKIPAPKWLKLTPVD